ncbi:caspase family protein [Pyxidicoccus fallax]|uniref:Caspase family protein n=1 Tax=Pyxidicoccus fallax TaxID=394095 RepID=A0A848L8C1_9BACT|nr:caspase family protein [Pyxidicoccus fallax]NMO14492.1 caspase family protein [Pyxidicoccus fallax]NPC82953.1 caspase family protein [Pyxidicoccus fallax]
MAQGYSLNIGLNSVDPAHYAGWDGALLACEADAEDMELIARAQDFGTVRKVLTREATRERIVKELDEAAQVLQPGDLFLLTYSGHGGQLPDRNNDEVDAQDETWVLYDGELIDDEIYVALSKLRQDVRVLMFSDSCHSGTVSRMAYAALRNSGSLEMLADTVQDTEAAERRFKDMPVGIALRTYRNNRAMYDAVMDALPKQDARSMVKATVLLISGCQDNQLSSDGTFNGLFTANLLRVYNGGKFRGSHRTFHRRIVRRMPPLQTPNYSVIGYPNSAFERQTPFTV